MSYKRGDIVLIRFPFSNLSKSKKRPVLMMQEPNEKGDFTAFQITSNGNQKHLLPLKKRDLLETKLTVDSYLRYDKCFTLSSEIIDKKIAKVNEDLMQELKKVFCNQI